MIKVYFFKLKGQMFHFTFRSAFQALSPFNELFKFQRKYFFFVFFYKLTDVSSKYKYFNKENK